MPSFRDLPEVAACLSDQDLPFTWYVMGPEGGAIEFDVAPQECDTAVQHFADHPLTLADGTPVPVVVKPRRGASWTLPPEEGAGQRSDSFDDGSLIGLDVEEAAGQASAAGWFVLAHERDALVTAYYRPGRLNLRYDDDRRVEAVSRG